MTTTPSRTPEVTLGHVVQSQDATSTPGSVAVVVEPTQVRRPWRTTIRTGFQATVALASLIPFIVTGAYGDAETPAVVTQVVVVSGAVSRVMALPQVETFLRTFLPWLAAAPAPQVDQQL